MMGWNGINIEPLPDKFEKLVKTRKKDINLNIAVGAAKGNASLYISGVCSKLLNKHSKKSNHLMNVNIDTMANVCKNYIPIQKNIHFCKIDVEGWEKNVLLGYDFKNYRPKVFCIESTYPGSSKPCHQLWEYILLKNDYSFVYQYKINRYYIDNRFPKLAERFSYIDEFIKKYKNNI